MYNDYLIEWEEIRESEENNTIVIDNIGDNIVIENEQEIIELILKEPKQTLRKN